MRYASLGSGSEGNGLVVQGAVDGTRRDALLIDCGFGLRVARERLTALSIEPDRLAAILVTHEHSDHIGGVYRLAAAHDIPVYLTHGTLVAAGPPQRPVRLNIVHPDECFDVAGLRVLPVPVPHDAREPVQFVIDDGRCRLGVLTDLGHGSPHVLRAYSGLDALVLECNHDRAMLAANPRYPPSLKRRIGGPWGHLSNDAAAGLLAGLDRSRLRRLAAAHLSAHNNTQALARSALAAVLGGTEDDVAVAEQGSGLAWTEIG